MAMTCLKSHGPLVSWAQRGLFPGACGTRSGPLGGKARPPSWPSDGGAAEQLLLTLS